MQDGAKGPGVRVLQSMVDDLESLCLIKECRELEEWFGVKYVDSILGDGDFCLREAKEEIEDKDRKKTIEAFEKKVPLVGKVARKCGWMVLWDRALERGWKHTKGLQAFSRLIGDKGRGETQCPYCKNSVPDETLLWTHCVMDHEVKSSIIDEIAAGDSAPAYSFWNIF